MSHNNCRPFNRATVPTLSDVLHANRQADGLQCQRLLQQATPWTAAKSGRSFRHALGCCWWLSCRFQDSTQKLHGPNQPALVVTSRIEGVMLHCCWSGTGCMMSQTPAASASGILCNCMRNEQTYPCFCTCTYHPQTIFIQTRRSTISQPRPCATKHRAVNKPATQTTIRFASWVRANMNLKQQVALTLEWGQPTGRAQPWDCIQQQTILNFGPRVVRSSDSRPQVTRAAQLHASFTHGRLFSKPRPRQA